MSLRINDQAPNFTAETTQGKITFHDWIGDNWAVLFSHPKKLYACVHHRAWLYGKHTSRFFSPKYQNYCD